MPLIKEDGTGVDNANTYITVAELRAFANDRGVAFPAVVDPDDAANIAIFTPFLILANDFLESLRTKYSGFPTYVAGLTWPRQDVWVDWQLLDTRTVPQRVKSAQAQLVIEQLQGIALQPSMGAYGKAYIPPGPNGPILPVDNRFVTVDKIDVIETQYSQTIGANLSPILPAVMAFLQPLLASGGSNFFGGVRV